MTIIIANHSIFVPFELVVVGRDGVFELVKQVKRDDLPRFKEPEEAASYIQTHPEISHRNGKVVRLMWVESHGPEAMREFLDGVGIARS